MTEWGDWAYPVPLAEAGPVGRSTHEVRPRLYRVAHGWEAVPVRYRTGRTGWDTARLSAWARPIGAEGWPVIALTYLSACYPASDRQRTHSGQPRWRTSWVIYDPALVEQLDPEPRYPSAYWRDQLSAALAQFAEQLAADGFSPT